MTYDDGREEYEGIKLNRYGMQEVAGHVCFVNFRPPEKASYQLVIYAKDLEDQVSLYWLRVFVSELVMLSVLLVKKSWSLIL